MGNSLLKAEGIGSGIWCLMPSVAGDCGPGFHQSAHRVREKQRFWLRAPRATPRFQVQLCRIELRINVVALSRWSHVGMRSPK